MRTLLPLLLAVCGAAHAQDWTQWRGPTRDNHAPPGATAPIEWGEQQNIAWRAPLPGRGHSSPTIVGDRIYLTTADQAAETQSLLVIGKQDGRILKETVTHTGGLPEQIHPSNTHASPTVASDGVRVYALFYNDGGAWVTAYELEGEQVWQRRVCAFDPQQFQFGFGSSPTIENNLLIVASEYDGPGSGIYALSLEDGQEVWSTARPQNITFSSPIAGQLQGRRQLLLSGSSRIAAYDPDGGDELWNIEGSTLATCGTMVWHTANNLAFASGGYPASFTCAVKVGPQPEIVWGNGVKCYEQSLLVVGDYLYAVADSGVAYCWRASDGEEQWKARLGGKYSSSPVLVDDVIYVSSEDGTTHVYRANPERFERLATNRLGGDCYPTTTPSGGRLYHRYGQGDGSERQEFLVAIGE